MVSGKQIMSFQYEVAVVGAGPAGLCAAVASARMGAKTALIEHEGTLGGNLTVGHVGPVMGSVSPGTLKDEIVSLLGTGGECVQHDVEQTKIALAEWIGSENIDVFLRSHVTDAILRGSTIAGVRISAPGGEMDIHAQIVVDATGDGNIASRAGAPFEIGRDDGLTQPSTIMFTLGGINPEATIVCRHEEDDTDIGGSSYLQLCRDAEKSGELPENVSIVRLYPTLRPDERMINASQLNGKNGLDPKEIAQAEFRLRAQLPVIHRFLQKHVPGFADSYIKDSSEMAGFRETRRIQGEYILTAEDIIAGRAFPDAVVHKANFCIDIHNPDGGGQAESEGCPQQAQDYDIPYRCLLPLRVENLLVAGRCISGTHRAHASYRVMGICMATGQAAGIAAALAVQQGKFPRSVDAQQIRKLLMENGAVLED